jgi:hypothetical protein
LGLQDKNDAVHADYTFYQVLQAKRKIAKRKAEYRRQTDNDASLIANSCVKCKFNLGDEGKCHVVGGTVDNERGLSKFFSPKGHGMLPGDVVWLYVKHGGKKLKYKEGHIIKKGAQGFQCKDCKYYLYSGNCLLIEGKFSSKMSCGFIVKLGSGTKV